MVLYELYQAHKGLEVHSMHKIYRVYDEVYEAYEVDAHIHAFNLHLKSRFNMATTLPTHVGRSER